MAAVATGVPEEGRQTKVYVPLGQSGWRIQRLRHRFESEPMTVGRHHLSIRKFCRLGAKDIVNQHTN
jgi:hypothetical protein